MRNRPLTTAARIASAASLFGILLAAAPASAGPLLDKALAYSDNWQERHGVGYGCRVETVWADATQTVPVRYEDIGDAVSWTGPYVGAEALRWHVTRDPQAKINARRGLECLLAAEAVTSKPGFVVRSVTPFEGPWAAYVGNTCEPSNNCHLITDGPYAGAYWLGNTSSDTYIGWFYGMLLTSEFLLDEPGDADTRAAVSGAVERVMDALIADGYLIVLPDGNPSDTAPEITGNERIAFHEVAARVVGGRFADMMAAVYQRELFAYLLSTWAPFNTYFQYFAYNLGHTLQHTILLADSPNPDFDRFVTRENLYRWVAGAQQSFFDFVAWGEGAAPYAESDVAADRAVLNAVPFPPRLKVQPAQGAYTPDPVVDLLNFLGPIIAQLIGLPGGWDEISPKATEPFPPGERCVVGFMWDNNPADVCGGSDELFEYAGDDYLIAYWLGRYYGLLSAAD